MKIGLFFGAGAEICYGLPSGGKFAIDLFRQDPSTYKTRLRNSLQNIDARSTYATSWLPSDYQNKRIHAFGKNEFTSLIESSIEYRRSEIIRRLNQFDVECDNAMTQLGIDSLVLRQKFQESLGQGFGEMLYTHTIRLNSLIANNVLLFSSEFYSAMLDVVRHGDQVDDLKRYASSFLQLLVGAHGQDLVQRLNQELFETAPDDIPIFDDISGMFRLEFSRAGSMALELLLEEQRSFQVGENASISHLLCAIAQRALENIFTTVLDYQALIDSHFRYLYSPCTEWAKFTRMAIFLQIARDYIEAQAPDVSSLHANGYYHDLAHATDLQIEFTAIGTANYNSILEEVADNIGVSLPNVLHLNGSIKDYYNPYKNSVVTCNNPEDCPTDQILVPFILTQSGLKPLTSVAMSRRYVDLFDSFQDSDAIVVIGFGFNSDDSHINGLFRDLIENHNKSLFWISRISDGTAEEQKRNLIKRLRVDPSKRNLITVIPVNTDTRKIDDQLWINIVFQRLNE